MDTISINGVDYIKASDVKCRVNGSNTIVIIPNGWIFVGILQECEDSFNKNSIMLKDASVVRKWTNGHGIGGLARAEYKDEYALDPCNGVVIIPVGAINAMICCEW